MKNSTRKIVYKKALTDLLEAIPCSPIYYKDLEKITQKLIADYGKG